MTDQPTDHQQVSEKHDTTLNGTSRNDTGRKRKPFTLRDMEHECVIDNDCYRLDGQTLGSRIHVPSELATQYPYNASAYTLMQQLRGDIIARGTLEFPGLPVNKSNYTLAQRAPKQHGYSPNPYMTDICQFPHQDTPPYPTGFWLAEERRYFSTWVMSLQGLKNYIDYSRQHPHLGIEELHRVLVPASLLEHTGLLLNRNPGLLLIDNSNHRKLYHARTCNFTAVNANPAYTSDAAMYAFNEIGLLNFIDTLDIHRGDEHRDPLEVQAVKAFMAAERL